MAILAKQEDGYYDIFIEQAAEIAGIGHWIFDEANSRYLYVSSNFATIFGMAPGEFLTEKWLREDDVDDVHPDDLDAVVATYETSRKNGERYSIEYRVYSDDGTIRWIQEIGAGLECQDGVWTKMIGTVQDITERKNKEESLRLSELALRHAMEEAEAASRSKSEFLATMSHEIRTPMTGVMGLADLLLQENLPQNAEQMVFKIKDATDSLLKILNDILDISKLEAGKMEIESVAFDLRGLIDDVYGFFSHMQGGGPSPELDFSVDLTSDFPARVTSDPTRIRQILVNLVGNALKFTNHGGVSITGAIQTIRDREFIRFEVHDTGIGMEPETLDKLFREFSQGDSKITREFEGTGLGLSICKRFVNLMGGDIGVESEHGKGSTFWFVVPYVAAPGTEDTVDHDASHVVDHIDGEQGLRLLAVDDNDLNLQIIKAMTAHLGHTTVTVTDGASAIEALKQDPFDLVLMDIRMPGMSGVDVTRIIRDMDTELSTIPIIALTADAMLEHRTEYLAAGMDEVITKPIDWGELARVIDVVMHDKKRAPTC